MELHSKSYVQDVPTIRYGNLQRGFPQLTQFKKPLSMHIIIYIEGVSQRFSVIGNELYYNFDKLMIHKGLDFSFSFSGPQLSVDLPCPLIHTSMIPTNFACGHIFIIDLINSNITESTQ